MKRLFVTTFCLFLLSIIYASTTDTKKIQITLKRCIEIALENDFSLKEAHKDVVVAAAQLKRAKSSLYPNFSASTTYSRRYPPPEVHLPGGYSVQLLEENQHDLTFSLNYLLYDGGGVKSLKSQAMAQLEVYKTSEEKIRQDVIYRTSIAYFNALKNKNFVLVAEEALKLSEEQLKIAKERYNAGTVALADVLKAKSQLADAEVNLIKAKNIFDVSLTGLNDAMGVPLDTKLELNEEYPFKTCNITMEESLKNALENRLEINIMKKSLEAGNYAIKFAKSLWYPQIFFNLDYTGWSNSLLAQDNTVVATVGARFNIFDGMQTSAKVEEAKALQEKLAIQMEEIKKKIKLDVTKAFLDFQSAYEKVFKVEENLNFAKESYRTAQTSYKEGITPFIDVNAAQVMLTNTEVNKVQAIFDYYIAKIELLRAMGLLGKVEIEFSP